MPGQESLTKWQAQGYQSQREAFESNDPPPGFKGFATGGLGTRDNVPAMLMSGEYVVNKDSVNRYGKNFFDQLNSAVSVVTLTAVWLGVLVALDQAP